MHIAYRLLYDTLSSSRPRDFKIKATAKAEQVTLIVAGFYAIAIASLWYDILPSLSRSLETSFPSAMLTSGVISVKSFLSTRSVDRN